VNRITFPPREISPELEGTKAGKDGMIEKPTQPSRIVTADLKGIPLLMTSGAFTFHSCNFGHNFFTPSRIFCHFD
jgi:hypothetical protein